ncbi:MAG: PAS domain-containing protein, partial [Vicinamibacterales bacterium]
MLTINGLPWRASLFLISVTLLASTALALALALFPPRPADGIGLPLTFVAAMTVAWLFPLRVAFKTKLMLDTSLIVAAVLLFDPGTALLVCLAGTVAAYLIRRQPWDEGVFNCGQVVLQTAVAGGIFGLSGWDVDAPAFSDPLLLPVLALAGLGMYLVNDLCLATMIALHSGDRPRSVWQRAHAGGEPVEYVAFAGQLGLGLLIAVLIRTHPLALGAVALALAALYAALARGMELRRQLADARRDSGANLADAQRIVGMGSWEWDLATGAQSWSTEVARLLGYPSGRVEQGYESLLAGIHPGDRAMVDRAVHAALQQGSPYCIEHRIRLADGDRVIQQRGEIVFDADGNR